MTDPVKIALPRPVEKALARLTDKGFSAYAVGGCVRDSLLGLAPGDWDLCSAALPHQVLALFYDCHPLTTGAAHGTITVHMDGMPLEITTFRLDGLYTDHRRPQGVRFTAHIEQDLARRDFTINAMAYHPHRGLIDRFGGQQALQARQICCVGDPHTRFAEDALRILRALRFSATLGFSIAPETADAMACLAPTLQYTSAQRKCAELKKLLTGPRAAAALRDNRGVTFALLPALSPTADCTQPGPWHDRDVFSHTLKALENAENRLNVRLAVLLHDIGKPLCRSLDARGHAHFYGHCAQSARLAEALLEALRFEKKTVLSVCRLIELHGEPLPMPEIRVKRLLSALGAQGFADLLAVIDADLHGQRADAYDRRAELLLQARQLGEAIVRRADCLSLSALAVKGGDLLALGFSPGPRLGRTLAHLLQLVMDGQAPNRREALLALARKALEEP